MRARGGRRIVSNISYLLYKGLTIYNSEKKKKARIPWRTILPEKETTLQFVSFKGKL